MAQENHIVTSFTQDLEGVFGEVITKSLLEYLRKENAIAESGLVDAKKLGLALEALFGEASPIVMQKLMLAQKKSISFALR